MPYNPPASNTKAGNGQDLYLSSNGGQIQGDLTVAGDLQVDAQANVIGIINANIGSGNRVALESVAGGAAVSLYNGTTNAASFTLDPIGNILTLLGTPSNPILNALGGVVTSSITGPSATQPNFPLGLLVEGHPLTNGIVSSSTAGGNNSWWVKFSPPGSLYSFALVGGSGEFSAGGATTGGMTIYGPPFTNVIACSGASLKPNNVVVSLDVGGVDGPAGQIKMYAVAGDTGTVVGAGTPMYAIALVLITN